MGQERLKEALLCVATDDAIDGLLVSGEKGTAKSTLVRGLVDLLGEQRAIADCPYGCPPGDRQRQCVDCRDRATFPVETRPVPLVTLPLGATRERVVGTLSVSDALAGDATFDPGLLARANRGLLYVDEVNLLEDHLVDVLLDAATSGVNRVERDGISRTHPAEFTLVGTMNPEEGDLRPQLRDRFALSVDVQGERDLENRVAIIDVNVGCTPEGLDDDTDRHRRRLRDARELLDSVAVTDEPKREIAKLCLRAGVDGHRADIATVRAARALAALEGRPTVTDGDLRRAASFALGHRMRSTPFEDAPDAEAVIDEHFENSEAGDGSGTETDDASTDEGGDGEVDTGSGDPEAVSEYERNRCQEERDESGSTDESAETSSEDRSERSNSTGGEPAPTPEVENGDKSTEAEGADIGETEGYAETSESDEVERATPLVPGQSREPIDGAAAPDLGDPTSESRIGDGRAKSKGSTRNDGVRIRTEPGDESGSVDAAASVRAAATRGHNCVETRDLRRSVRSGGGEALVVFAVDASASMRPAMAAAKSVVLELLEGSYTERDSVAVVAFAGEDAEVLLPPTDSVSLAARHLKTLPTGDRTPLQAGLRMTARVIDRAEPESAVAVVVSDGRANVGANPTIDTRDAAAALASTGAQVVCVETGEGRGLLADVANAADGSLVPLEGLTAERVESELAGTE